MSRVDTMTCLATTGVVQLTARSVFAVTVAFKTGALMVGMPGPPTTTACTLSVPFTTSSRKSPVGKDATELTYGPFGGTACTSVIDPFVSEAFCTVTVAPPTVFPAPSLTVTLKVVSGAPAVVEALMSPCTLSVLLPAPALLRLVAALLLLVDPHANAAAAAARMRMRFIMVLLWKKRVAKGCLTSFRIGPLVGKARPRHVIGDARAPAADVLRRAGLCAAAREDTCLRGAVAEPADAADLKSAGAHRPVRVRLPAAPLRGSARLRLPLGRLENEDARRAAVAQLGEVGVGGGELVLQVGREDGGLVRAGAPPREGVARQRSLSAAVVAAHLVRRPGREPDSHGAAMLHSRRGGDPVPRHLHRARPAGFADIARRWRTGARLARGGLPLEAPPADEPPHAHTDQGGGGDRPVHPLQEPADVVEVLAEQVAERHHCGHGNGRAEHVGEEERPQAHARRAGKEEDGRAQPRRVPADDHRPEPVAGEVDAQLLRPLRRDDLADELVLVRLGAELLAPVVDERVAHDDARVPGQERRQVAGHALRGERAGEEQDQVLADRHAEPGRREEEQQRGIRVPLQELGERVLH